MESIVSAYHRRIGIFWSGVARIRCLKVARLSFSCLNPPSLSVSASVSYTGFPQDDRTNTIFSVSSMERQFYLQISFNLKISRKDPI